MGENVPIEKNEDSSENANSNNSLNSEAVNSKENKNRELQKNGEIDEITQRLEPRKLAKPVSTPVSDFFTLDPDNSNIKEMPDDLDKSVSKAALKGQNNSSHVIYKEKFEQILNTYKSRSFLGYLSTFWIFSWISPTRSQTMRELKSLLSSIENQEVSRKQIKNVLRRGDYVVHRLGLFKEEHGVIKNGSGTDEVIIQLRDAMKIK